MEPYKLILSGTRALLSAVTPNIRRVSIAENDDLITLYFYYDEPPSELEVDESECVATEVIADFDRHYGINCVRKVVSYPERVNVEGYAIYARYEEDPDLHRQNK